MNKIKLKKKYMVIVPHADDEISIAGSIIYELSKKNENIYVLYTTNGDYFFNGKIRLKESIDALNYFGIPENHIIFLGYGDGWKTKNIYNGNYLEILESNRGKKETYGLDNHPEYRYQKNKYHSTYTRNNYKTDMKDAILDVEPDVFMVVDFDNHPEHRATSLIFEEVMGDILKEKDNYHPIVLKKFAYSSSWYGESDYYSIPKLITKPPKKNEVLDSNYELDNPYYTWEKRIQFSVPKETNTLFLRDNILFKAAKKHVTQMAWHRIIRVSNSDIVFWLRRTDSLTYHAKIKVTSGNAEYLNDFKLIDCDNVMSEERNARIINKCLWSPDEKDSKKEISIYFKKNVSISQLVLYQNFDISSNIKSLQVTFSNGYVTEVKSVFKKKNIINVIIPKQNNILNVKICILDYEGKKPGFSEIEVYENTDDNNQILPLQLYKNENYDFRINLKKYRIKSKIERLYLDFIYGCEKIIFITVIKLIKILKL